MHTSTKRSSSNSNCTNSRMRNSSNTSRIHPQRTPFSRTWIIHRIKIWSSRILICSAFLPRRIISIDFNRHSNNSNNNNNSSNNNTIRIPATRSSHTSLRTPTTIRSFRSRIRAIIRFNTFKSPTIYINCSNSNNSNCRCMNSRRKRKNLIKTPLALHLDSVMANNNIRDTSSSSNKCSSNSSNYSNSSYSNCPSRSNNSRKGISSSLARRIQDYCIKITWT